MSARNTTQLVMEIESHSVMSNSLQSHGYPVHGILQARLLESVPFPSPRDLPNPGVEPRSPALQVNSLSAEPSEKPSDRKAIFD